MLIIKCTSVKSLVRVACALHWAQMNANTVYPRTFSFQLKRGIDTAFLLSVLSPPRIWSQLRVNHSRKSASLLYFTDYPLPSVRGKKKKEQRTKQRTKNFETIESRETGTLKQRKMSQVFTGFCLVSSWRCHDDTRICEGEKVHSMDHSMRVFFVRPRNFPAMSIFFPPCQHLLCEAARISYQRTDKFLNKEVAARWFIKLQVRSIYCKGLIMWNTGTLYCY